MDETQRLEWKESWRDESMKAICSFANASGGVLVIERNDKGGAVGVRDARKLLQDIPNKVCDLLGIIVDVDLRVDAGKDTVEVTVVPYENTINYKGEYYYCRGSTNQALNGAALDRFLLRKVGRHWDGAPVPHVAIKDLSRGAIGTFRKQARETRRLHAAILREPVPGQVKVTGDRPVAPTEGNAPLRAVQPRHRQRLLPGWKDRSLGAGSGWSSVFRKKVAVALPKKLPKKKFSPC